MNKKLCELQIGDVLKNDIWKGNTLLLKKGSKLSNLKLEKLRQWGYNKVTTTNESYSESDEKGARFQKKSLSPVFGKNQLIGYEVKMRKLFFETIALFAHDYRYGSALHDFSKMVWIEELFVETMSITEVDKLMQSLKNYDLYSYHHSVDVFILSSLLAKKMGFIELEKFSLGSMLHDIGKTVIPLSILTKEATISEIEYHVIKSHAKEGYKIVKSSGFTDDIARCCIIHHERLDGSGYPAGLRSKELFQLDRILMIVDTYAALTSDRPYRKMFTAHEAMKIILNNPEQYDLDLLKEFMMLLSIYPKNTILKFSDGFLGRVIDVNDDDPLNVKVEYINHIKPTFKLADVTSEVIGIESFSNVELNSI
ncbi:MAG: HD domain-containing phosphohydrolase [Anaerobacillus sp.]